MNNDKFLSFKQMNFKKQMQNIGSEVSRAIRFKLSGDLNKAKEFSNVAIELLNIVKDQSESIYRKKEFEAIIEEFEDWMNGSIKYDSDYTLIQNQFDCFL